MKINHHDTEFIKLNDDSAEAFYREFYLNGERIEPLKLQNRGYRFTSRFLAIGRMYKLFELFPEQSSRSATVCFLAPGHKQCGVLVQAPFHEHKALLTFVSARKRTGIPRNWKVTSPLLEQMMEYLSSSRNTGGVGQYAPTPLRIAQPAPQKDEERNGRPRETVRVKIESPRLLGFSI